MKLNKCIIVTVYGTANVSSTALEALHIALIVILQREVFRQVKEFNLSPTFVNTKSKLPTKVILT